MSNVEWNAPKTAKLIRLASSNFVLAMADDRRVTRGGPAAVLERSMLGKKTQLDPCLAAKMDPAALDRGASRGGRGWGHLSMDVRHRGCSNAVQLASVAAPNTRCLGASKGANAT
jgi:hypothetical protein